MILGIKYTSKGEKPKSWGHVFVTTQIVWKRIGHLLSPYPHSPTFFKALNAIIYHEMSIEDWFCILPYLFQIRILV